jgi:hypothetical protein
MDNKMEEKNMKRLLIALLVVLGVAPLAFAVDTGTGIGLDVTPEEFGPLIWMCDSRAVWEDSVEEGRNSTSGEVLSERIQNYAFEGEQLSWRVLVMDKNKIEQVQDVVATLGTSQGTGNDVEVECAVDSSVADGSAIPASCNARILEEELTTFDDDTQAFYDCVLTVETQNSMFGEYFITVEVISEDGEDTMDENEYWFLNPNIAVTIDGGLSFDNVRPGTVSYSDTVLVGNDADDGSGVLLDMFVSGTDFFDPASSGAKCPVSNRLKLSHSSRAQAALGAGDTEGATATRVCGAGVAGLTTDDEDHLCYFATNGAYSTATIDGVQDNQDAEGYRPIVYSDVFTRDFYNDAEVIANDELAIGGALYDAGNVLAPGAEIAVTFKLGLPEPCVGDFSDGSVYFWGEAI